MTIAKLGEQSNRLPPRPSAGRPRQTMVAATDVVLLWPRGLAKQAVSNPARGCGRFLPSCSVTGTRPLTCRCA